MQGQIPVRASGEESVDLWLQSVMMAGLWWRSRPSRIGIGYPKEFGLHRAWNVAEKSASEEQVKYRGALGG